MKTAAAALLVVTSVTAQAAEPETLTLACQGTTTSTLTPDAKPEPISMGIIIDFAARTVVGLGDPEALGFPVKITRMNEVTIGFSGSHEVGMLRQYGSFAEMNGSIDRVTGDVDASYTTWEPVFSGEGAGRNVSGKTFYSQRAYSLKCRPAQRMF